MHDDFERCYRAVQSKDARFDGWFVTAVTTTRIYCRPSCPVPAPRARSVRFYPSSAAAQQAGFRACKRCRPDATPGSPEWNMRADLVARAMRLIADGVVDREGVSGLASRLGYSQRQIERHLVAEVGAGPLALARAQRAQTARLLIETTDLPFAAVAFGAGFASIRQFNDTVRAVFATTPSELRRRARRSAPAESHATPAFSAIDLRLPFRLPFCPDNLFGHLVATAAPGCEEFRDGAYRRTLRLPHGAGVASLTPRPSHIDCRLLLQDLRDLPAAIARCRRVLDLDADPQAVVDALSDDDVIAPLVRKAPGRRVPGTVDPDEFAVRAVLGQQVSTAAARTHASRLVGGYGESLVDPEGGLTHVFPAASQLLDAPVAGPASRRQTLSTLVRALAAGTIDLSVGGDWERAKTQLLALPGIGPWTVAIIAMRAFGDPDAFPASDLGVRRAAAELGLPTQPAALLDRALRWRPWRAYATQYLWATLDHPINHWAGDLA